MTFVHQGPTFDAQLEPHHAAGRLDGRVGGGRRLRPRRLAGLLRHEQRRGQPEPSVPQQRRRHLRGRRRGRRARRRQSGRHRRVDGRGLGRLRQRRLRGPLPLQVRPAGALPQRRRPRVRARVRAARACRAGSTPTAPIWLDYDRDGRLDLFLAGYWPEQTRPLAPADDADHAGELRVRRERRPEVPAPQPRRRHVRGDVGRRWASQPRRWTLAAAAADLSGTGYPDLFLANDYGVSELFANQGGKRFVDVGRETRRGPDAEERDERVVRRRLQRRPAVDLQDQHLRAGRARAGQRPLGAEGARGRRRRRRVREPGVERSGVDLGGWSWGAQFGDLNNDGTLDSIW